MTASVEMISSWRYLRYAAMNPLSHKTLHCSVIFPKTVPVKMPWRVGIIGAASGTNEGPTNGQEGTSHGGWLNMTVLSCKKSFHLCRELLQFGKVRSPLSLTFGLKKTAGIITANFTICDANVASLHMFFFFNVVAVYKLNHSVKTPHWSGTSINSSLRSTMLHPPTSHPPSAPGGVKILDCGRCIGPGRDACACICSICPAKGGGGIDIQGYA